MGPPKSIICPLVFLQRITTIPNDSSQLGTCYQSHCISIYLRKLLTRENTTATCIVCVVLLQDIEGKWDVLLYM